ncbi:MAG: sulfotransferase domain-containing protein [Rhizobium sp.]|nr:sulfotransferase domain-containing protein [Rhizobium sp.]
MLVLHVGPHKTATTWLQRNFHHNAAALEKAGWLYPQTGERVAIAHHDLSDSQKDILDDGSRKVAQIRKILDRASENNLNVLLSSEGFDKWRPNALERLRALVAPHELKIVYTLRDPVSLVYSIWAQKVKTGGPKSFPEHYEEQVRKAGKSRALDPLSDIEKFAAVDDSTLTVLLYDEIRRQDRDIFDVFCVDVLGVGKLPHDDAGSANDREPLELTEFMRAMVLRAGRWKGGDRVHIGQIFRHMVNDRTRQEIVSAVAAVPSARRSTTVARDDETLVRMERKLLRKFAPVMVPAPGPKLFLDGPAQFEHYDTEILEADSRVRALLDDFSRKFKPGGIRMRMAGAARSALMIWRRLANRFR